MTRIERRLSKMSKCKDNLIITIGRSFGSGGREVGKIIAAALEIPFYDKELLEVTAKETKGVSTTYLELFDEKRPSGFLYSMALNPYQVQGQGRGYTGEGMPLDMVLQEIQTKTIMSVADKGPCVIIGRRADKILRYNYDIVSVFISSSMEKRIARVSQRDGLSEKESKKAIQKADKTRRSYYNSYGEGDWGEAANYNLCIDSGAIGIDNAAALILEYLKLKGKLV